MYNRAKFLQNGNCGYVLKPRFMSGKVQFRKRFEMIESKNHEEYFQMLPHIPYHPPTGYQDFLEERWLELKIQDNHAISDLFQHFFLRVKCILPKHCKLVTSVSFYIRVAPAPW